MSNEVKQLQMNELTMFQQIALEAEVVSIMNDCDNDYEKMYYAFLKLALCDEKYLLVYKQEFMKYLEESQVNDLIGYRYKEIIPTYLQRSKVSEQSISSYARKYRSLIPCPHPNVVFVL